MSRKLSALEKEKLIKRLIAALPQILKDTPVILAYLHGSTATGATGQFSDVDVAILIDPDAYEKLSTAELFDLETNIAVTVEAECRVPDLDLRIINNAPLIFQGKVVQQGILLFTRDEHLRIGYETLTLKKYLDFKPTADFFQRFYFQQRLAELEVRELKGKYDD